MQRAIRPRRERGGALLSRRLLLAAAAATCAVPFAGGRAAEPPQRAQMIAGWHRRVEALLARGRLPIIDLQATYAENRTNLARMIQAMDEADVAQIAWAVAFQPNAQLSLDLHRQHPERFIPTTNSGEFPRWWNDPLAFLAVARQDLATGLYFSMGEHEFRHYPSPEQVEARQFQRDITVPLDSPAGDALFQLSADTGVPFQIHYEIEDALLPALEAVLARHPKARPIWCHLAMIRYPDRARNYTPAYVRSLVERFPGLHFDLAVSPPWYVYPPSGARDSTLFRNREGALDERWKALIEEFPERFLAASDYRPAIEDRYVPYVTNVQRGLILAALSERARHLVAYGNAWRLVTGEPWR